MAARGRALVIWKVLDTRRAGSRRHVLLACGLIWAVSLLLGAPALWYRRLDGDDCWDEDGEDFSLAMVFLTFLLPLGVISFCYCSIYCRLQRHVRLGRGVRRSHRAIVAIVAAFVCSWLPLNACKVLLFLLAKGTLAPCQRGPRGAAPVPSRPVPVSAPSRCGRAGSERGPAEQAPPHRRCPARS